MAEKKLNFLADFPAVSTQEWMDKIIADLKGADFTKKLVWRTPEGFNVNPFYRAEDVENLQTTASAPGQYPYVRGTRTDNVWLVRQDIKTKDAAKANAKALFLLDKGVNALGFTIDREQLTAEYIATLLRGIPADTMELNFHICNRRAPLFIGLLVDYFQAQQYDLSQLKGSVGVDPIGRMLKKGRSFQAEDVSKMLLDTLNAAKALPKYRVVGVNSLLLSNAGAYCSQELGYALAWGNQYLEMMTEAGVTAADAALTLKFNMGVGGNYFMEIAKFRAARMLWAKIVRAYEPVCTCDESCTCEKVEGKYCPCAMKMKVHAETSTFNKTIYDAHVNLLRCETEAMSAALGGVDSLTVNPFDSTYKTSDDFSERIARNQQLLLKEESHFEKVVDPAAGSYYLENLTAMLAEQAWKIFLEVQNAGGFFQAVKENKIQTAMQETLAKRQKDVAARKEIYLGTNQYPNFNEMASDKMEASGKGCCCGCGEAEPVPGCTTLPNTRAAAEFEELRLATERSGKRPKVFMLTIGNLAMRLARSQFSSNFFACAGYEIIDNLGFDTVEAGVEAARKAKADVVVLCSSDDEYAELAPRAFQCLQGGKELFVVAGAPACMEDLQKAGIQNYIHVKVNVLETLKSFNAQLLK